MEVLLRRIFDRSVSEFKPKSFVHFARRAQNQLLPQSPSCLLHIFVASKKTNLCLRPPDWAVQTQGWRCRRPRTVSPHLVEIFDGLFWWFWWGLSSPSGYFVTFAVGLFWWGLSTPRTVSPHLVNVIMGNAIIMTTSKANTSEDRNKKMFCPVCCFCFG